jgi:nitrile hydratase
MGEHDHDHTPISNGDEPAAAVRARALEELLVEKGVLRPEEIRAGIDWLVSRTSADGAPLVGRAWVDQEFKRRLQPTPVRPRSSSASTPAHRRSLSRSKTPRACTTLSFARCAPAIRGRCPVHRPPGTRVCRTVHAQCLIRAACSPSSGCRSATTSNYVLDSTADIRYPVIPRRPPGTDQLTEAQLAALVTRDSMIGVTEPTAPALA